MKKLTKNLKMIAVKENVISLLKNLQKMYIKDKVNYNLTSEYYDIMINRVNYLIEDIKEFKLDFENKNLFEIKGKFIFVEMIGNLKYMVFYRNEEEYEREYLRIMESYKEDLIESIKEYKRLMREKEWKYL